MQQCAGHAHGALCAPALCPGLLCLGEGEERADPQTQILKSSFCRLFGHHGTRRTQDVAGLELLTQGWVQFVPHTPYSCSLQPRPLQLIFLFFFFKHLLSKPNCTPKMSYPDQLQAEEDRNNGLKARSGVARHKIPTN